MVATFDKVSFKGEFRDYQQRVLNNSGKYLKDNKIHIVAAPGSGKTVLGLELIKRMNTPALILTPTLTIRQQWGDRFKDMFLPEDENINEYFSFNLLKPSLITSITYQTLYAAYNKTIDNDEEDEENGIIKASVDYSGYDIFKTLADSGITTICLDEAHHLRNEWQKALEAFIITLKDKITVISLTATPPYDSNPAEWGRYISVCGEIDEEIFIPQLVAQNTLCPHQDYIYFNYPSETEIQKLKEYKEKVAGILEEILENDFLNSAVSRSGILTEYFKPDENFYENADRYIELISILRSRNINIPKKLMKLLSPRSFLPKPDLSCYESVFKYIIDNPIVFGEENSDNIKHVLSKNGLYEKHTVYLKSDEKTNRMLISSIGKLVSINEIIKAEKEQLGNNLRMVVLTDYIKKDLISIIGTDKNIETISTVTVFESIRRSIGNDTKVALLSGSLVIVPDNIICDIQVIASEKNINYTIKNVNNTNFSELQFGSSNKNKVAVITDAFERGFLQIIVGTTALLGEGWDSPCINSLILASYVGSYMLSNQMRGRAIRTNKNNPDKTANIWHLVTIEPPEVVADSRIEKFFGKISGTSKVIYSSDYETLVRRFNGFIAPSYDEDKIESGIDRISIIKPPFDRKGIDNINRQMLVMAKDRAGMTDKWRCALGNSFSPQILEESLAPKGIMPRSFIFENILGEIIVSYLLYSIFRVLPQIFNSLFTFKSITELGLLLILITVFVRFMISLIHFVTPLKTIRSLSSCVLNTLKDMGVIESTEAKLITETNDQNAAVLCAITNATLYEKNIFASAVRELLSSFNNPRYIVIKKYNLLFFSVKRYMHSYACPSIIGNKKENAEIFLKYLKKCSGSFDLVFTRNEIGRKNLLKCRGRSYININEIITNGKKVTKP